MKVKLLIDDFGAQLSYFDEYKDNWSDYSFIDLSTFIKSINPTINRSINEYPYGFFYQYDVGKYEYIYVIRHNSNNIFQFPYEQDNKIANLYIPFIYFKWKIDHYGEKKKINKTDIGISYDNPLLFGKNNLEAIDVRHFRFTNVYSDGHICWGSHNIEGKVINHYYELDTYIERFLTEKRNNDLADYDTVSNDNIYPNEDGRWPEISREDWYEQSFVGSKYVDFFGE